MAADGPGRTASRTPSRRPGQLVLRALLVALLTLLVGLGAFVAGLLSAPIDFAVPAPPTAATLLAADGRSFASIPPPERRVVVTAREIPDVMRQAIISAEDERFLSHRGVDPLATVRAAFRDLTGGSTQGGSTLTQQYVKNVYVGHERTALRKVREAALAVRLEQTLSKQAILTDYLNALYLGNGVYGVQAAAAYYFGVSVKDLALDARSGRRSDALALARASILAGIAPAPSAWNPVRDFATARSRQTYTLNRMVAGGYISAGQATEAFRLDVRPLRVPPPTPQTEAPEFADYVTAQLKKDPTYDGDAFFRGGLRIRTTLDLDLQVAATRALHEVLPGASDPQAAFVAVDYRTGDIKAISSLRRAPALVDPAGRVVVEALSGYQRDGFDPATRAQRSSGSTIKPFTLAQALVEGHALTEVRPGPAALTVRVPGARPYVVHNSEPEQVGSYTLRRALADSVNTVYVPLAVEVGRAKVAVLASRAGLQGRLDPTNLSFGIGAGVEVTPLSEAVAYATLADGGVHVPPRAWTEIRTGAQRAGAVYETAPAPARERVLAPGVAARVVEAMTDVVTSGTGVAAAQPFAVFGKTGTTDASTDAWFTACIPQQHLCAATWMGYEYQTCTLARPGAPVLHVAGRACGGMHDLSGVRGQIFGGTLPARIFARTQELLRQIQADRAAAGPPVPAPTPSRAPALPATPALLGTTSGRSSVALPRR